MELPQTIELGGAIALWKKVYTIQKQLSMS